MNVIYDLHTIVSKHYLLNRGVHMVFIIIDNRQKCIVKQKVVTQTKKVSKQTHFTLITFKTTQS